MMKIRPVAEIKNELLYSKQSIRNFPKSINFPFDELYMDITTQIKTTEISSECILFDSVQAVNQTKIFSDADYWAANYAEHEIAKFWIFAQNGQGDLWIIDTENKIYFYDRNKEQMCISNFINLDLDFGKWLQFADLNKQLDDVFEAENRISDKRKLEYNTKLKELSAMLFNNYPFDI